MKKLVLLSFLLYFAAITIKASTGQAAPREMITVNTSIDVGNPTIDIGGTRYSWAFKKGLNQCNLMLNPPSKMSVVTLKGYFKMVEDQKIFIITSAVVTAQQG